MNHSFLILALLSALVLTGCASHRPLSQPVEHLTRDTVYINKLQYDSIYIDNRQKVYQQSDTIYLDRTKYEYRYRLLRDTVYKTHIDSIPIIREVEVVREIPRKHNWIDYLCYTITAIISGLLLIRVLRYLRGQ